MSLKILYFDELRGFYKSRIMGILWIGLPLISVLLHAIQPDMEGIPLSSFVGVMIAGMGGLLASAMLSTSIVNEKLRKVYDLFLIRPVHRWTLLVAKYLAVYTCLLGAVLLSLGLGIGIDALAHTLTLETGLEMMIEPLIISCCALAVACAMSILIGVLVDSVMVAAILAIYLGNQLSMLLALPGLYFENLDPVWFMPSTCLPIAALILAGAILLFNRKQF